MAEIMKHENTNIRGMQMKGDYGSLVWVNDEEGHEFVCNVEPRHMNKKRLEDLDSNERSTCQDVNQIVGTERW